MRKLLQQFVIRPALALGLAITLFTAPGLQAQEEAAAATTVAADVSLEVLKLRLKPLTLEQIEVEAKAWQKALGKAVSEVGAVDEKTLDAEGDAKTPLLEQSAKLRDLRVKAADRYRMVLDEWERKGGDVANDRKYMAAVTGVEIQPTNISGAVSLVTSWFQSPEGGRRWGLNLIKFIVVLLVARWISRVAANLAGRALNHGQLQVSELLRTFTVNSVRRVVFLIGLIMALSMLEVNVGPLLAGVGVIGFVLGFALQDTLSNFASGFMILLYRPYDVGDVITAGGVTGKVASMNLVSTTVETPDNQKVIVPNSKIWGDVITNITGNKTRRVDLTFGVGYGDDLAKAQKVLEEILAANEQVLQDPAPVVRVHELADSSVNFVVRPWCDTSAYWDVYWALTREVKERFDAEGISIPFPQQDVHMHNA